MLYKISRKRVLRSTYTDILPFSVIRQLKLLFKVKYGYRLDYPRQFWIEITNECSLKCIMCPVSKGLKRRRMFMSMDVFVKIINQINMVKPRIMLHVAGEPLLNKNLFKMIEYAKKRGCWVGIHTNAVLLTEEMSMRILDSSLDYISFSFDGYTPQTYEKIRIGAKFEQVRSQIETFLRLRYSRVKVKHPFTRIEILLMEETKADIHDFIKYWQARKIDSVNVKLAGTWAGLVDSHRSKTAEHFGYRPCRDVFCKCAILVDGTVVPCCNDIEGRMPLGNILKKSFNEIWNGISYNRLRIQHLKNTIPENIICHNCGFRFSWYRGEQITQWLLRQFF